MIAPKSLRKIIETKEGMEFAQYVTDVVRELDSHADITLTDPVEALCEMIGRQRARAKLEIILKELLLHENAYATINTKDDYSVDVQ